MNFTEQYVAMTVAVLAADGKLEAEEFETIRSIAQDLELDVDEVNSLMEKELQNPQDLKKVALTIKKKDDKDAIMSACVLVALADKYICTSEINLLLSIADMLKIEYSAVILTIAAVAQNDRSILIEGNAALYDEDQIIIDEDVK